jgi:hypothetical protein
MQEEDYSIRDVQEHSYTGWFWRLRSTLASIWIVIRHRETILIAVEINDSSRTYKLRVRFKGLVDHAVYEVVEQWAKFALTAEKLRTKAQKIINVERKRP